MELVYLWIERYNNIIDEEFNFSPNYKINYKTEENHLTVEKYQNEELNLFDEHFLNINAVVGKNGSGKTSLLSFFKIVFAQNKHDIWSYPFILVVKQEDGKLLLVDKSKKADITFDFADNEVVFNDDTQTLKDSIQPIYFANGVASFHNEDKIIPTDCFDASTLNSLIGSIRESNDMILNQYDEIRKQYHYSELVDKEWDEYNSVKRSLIRWGSPFSSLYRDDIVMKLNFISKFKDQALGLIPYYIELNFNSMFAHNNEISFKKVFSEKGFQSIINLLYRRSINPIKDNYRVNFKEGLVLSFFLYIIRHNLIFETTLRNTPIVVAQLNKIPEDKICKFIEDWIKDAELIRNDGTFYLIQSFVEVINEDIATLNFRDYGESEKLFLTIDDNSKGFLKKIFEIWYDSDFIFNLHWGNVSAGESAILTLFSRIYSISRNIRDKTIWLFLDEGELYLHPEWQRDFFKNLHTYLPKFFGGNKLQLVISSHSPFIISDIPKSNIIFLNKRANSTCEVLDSKMMPETFGANIHELLTNSFFMTSTSGEFVMNKIQEIVDFYYQVKMADEKHIEELKVLYAQKRGEYQFIAKNIGEDVIRGLLRNHVDFIEENLIEGSI